MRRGERRVDRVKIARDGRAPNRASPGHVRVADGADAPACQFWSTQNRRGRHDVRPAALGVAGEGAE